MPSQLAYPEKITRLDRPNGPKRKPPMTVLDIVRVRLCYVFFTPIIVRILCAWRRLRVEF